jgi:hypothetical protein
MRLQNIFEVFAQKHDQASELCRQKGRATEIFAVGGIQLAYGKFYITFQAKIHLFAARPTSMRFQNLSITHRIDLINYLSCAPRFE